MVGVADERERLRRTFDSVAPLYQEARPGYPAELYDALVASAGLKDGDRLLEMGCASGKATVPLADRGFGITCVELGTALADEARRNLASYPDVEVVNAPFEGWRPADGETFALVFAATAWKWADPVERYRTAWANLRPGGHLAFWDAVHVFPADGDPFFAEIQDVYDAIGEGDPGAGWPPPDELPDSRAEIEATGLFEDVRVRRFDWEITYTAEEYLRLLDTFSGHIAMEPWQRERLYGEIRRRLGERPDGLLRRHWGAVLNVARRRAI